MSNCHSKLPSLFPSWCYARKAGTHTTCTTEYASAIHSGHVATISLYYLPCLFPSSLWRVGTMDSCSIPFQWFLAVIAVHSATDFPDHSVMLSSHRLLGLPLSASRRCLHQVCEYRGTTTFDFCFSGVTPG